MLDIKFIKENKERVKESCANRNIVCDIDRLLVLDGKRKMALQGKEELNAEKNIINTATCNKFGKHPDRGLIPSCL